MCVCVCEHICDEFPLIGNDKPLDNHRWHAITASIQILHAFCQMAKLVDSNGIRQMSEKMSLYTSLIASATYVMNDGSPFASHGNRKCSARARQQTLERDTHTQNVLKQ